jgi:hypothetical protein
MQYEAYFNHKGVEIAQAVARKRAESEISMMEKHGFDNSKLEKWLLRLDFEADRVDEVRVKIQALEGKCTHDRSPSPQHLLHPSLHLTHSLSNKGKNTKNTQKRLKILKFYAH